MVETLICINSSTHLRDHEVTLIVGLYFWSYIVLFQKFGDIVFFTIRVDVVVLGSVMSVLKLNDSPTLWQAQRQTTKSDCTKVKLYQQSNLPEAQSFVSSAVGFDVKLYTKIWGAFSGVDPLIIHHPILISFAAVPWSRGNFLSALSLPQLHSFSKYISVPCMTMVEKFQSSLLECIPILPVYLTRAWDHGHSRVLWPQVKRSSIVRVWSSNVNTAFPFAFLQDSVRENRDLFWWRESKQVTRLKI